MFIHLLPEASEMAMEGVSGIASYPGLVLITGVATAMVFEVIFHHSGAHETDVEDALKDSQVCVYVCMYGM